MVSDASVLARLRNIGAAELNDPLAMGEVGDGSDWAGLDDPWEPSELFDNVRDDMGTIKCWTPFASAASLESGSEVILGCCCCL